MPNHISIVAPDSQVVLDGEAVSLPTLQTLLDKIELGIRAVQIEGDAAEVEYHSLTEFNSREYPVSTFAEIIAAARAALAEAQKPPPPLTTQELWAALRAQRDDLLSESDFTQIPGSPLTTEDREATAVWRQALRDLPANTNDPASPIWPVRPT